jgi:hypothetical protein
MTNLDTRAAIVERARLAAIKYCELTGKPLGSTGEIGAYSSAKILGLQLPDALSVRYGATDRNAHRTQIKTRSIPPPKE